MGENLDKALEHIKKQFGKGSIFSMGSDEAVDTPVVSTGCLSLDRVLGIGGIPRGRIIEAYGEASSGKSTLALQLVAQIQKLGEQAAYVDAENALDRVYMAKLGVNVDSLLISQPECGEEALEITDVLIRSNEVGIVVVDSVAALIPKAELEGDMADNQMGLQARLMGKAMRKLNTVTAKSGTVLFFINQVRDKIGVLFGSPHTTTGGKALKFYASIRLDIKRIAAIKDGDTVIGARTKIKVVKNKCAAPARECELDLIYGTGFSRVRDLIDLGVELGVIGKAGSWYSFEDNRLGQGRENTVELIENDAVLCATIEERVKGKL